jgi:hypothetical protein
VVLGMWETDERNICKGNKGQEKQITLLSWGREKLLSGVERVLVQS